MIWHSGGSTWPVILTIMLVLEQYMTPNEFSSSCNWTWKLRNTSTAGVVIVLLSVPCNPNYCCNWNFRYTWSHLQQLWLLWAPAYNEYICIKMIDSNVKKVGYHKHPLTMSSFLCIYLLIKWDPVYCDTQRWNRTALILSIWQGICFHVRTATLIHAESTYCQKQTSKPMGFMQSWKSHISFLMKSHENSHGCGHLVFLGIFSILQISLKSCNFTLKYIQN